MGDLLQDIDRRERNRFRRANLVLYAIITAVIIYSTVPTYGVIRDLIGEGEAVFSLVSSSPDFQTNGPKPGIIDKIREFLFPSDKVPVPVLERIDLKGRVIYTDKTLFVDGLVELRSEPSSTRTDQEGYFFFYDIEEGAHVINVLDDSGKVLASCNIEISRHEGIETATLVRLPDGTFVFQVSVRLEVLEITLTLQKDADGNILGIEQVELGLIFMTDPPDSVDPKDPVSPQEDDPFDFRVVDTVTDVPYGGHGSTDVNIFGDKKKLAPGMKGNYQFTVDNRRNDHASNYDVTFVVNDTLPAPYELPLVYRLKADGVYVAGNDNTWVTAEKLYQDRTLGAKSYVKYTLYWYWPPGEGDPGLMQFAEDERYFYNLEIRVSAERR